MSAVCLNFDVYNENSMLKLIGMLYDTLHIQDFKVSKKDNYETHVTICTNTKFKDILIDFNGRVEVHTSSEDINDKYYVDRVLLVFEHGFDEDNIKFRIPFNF